MGLHCCRPSKIRGEHSIKGDIILKNSDEYVSLLDSHLENFENSYNLLGYIELSHFTDYLFKINWECSLNKSLKQKSVKQNMLDEIQFIDFVEKKIINNNIIILKAYPDEELKLKFKCFLNNIFYELQTINQTYRDLIKDNVNITSITKTNLFSLGFVFCDSTNLGKIDQLFCMFSQDDKIKETIEFKEFIFLLFSLNSRVYYYCLKKFYNGDELFKNDETDLLEKSYSVDNIFSLKNFLFKEVFKDKMKLNKDEFYQAISENIWIFYGNFIRCKLEDVNKI